MSPVNRTLDCTGPSGPHRLAYTFWDGPADGPVHVLVHGLTRNSRDFDRLAERLARRGPVYAPDMPGRGRSDWLPGGVHYNYPLYCADVAALILGTGADRVDFVGTSMGGLIGMLLASQPGNMIRRLVMNDIGPFVPRAAQQRIAGNVGGDPRFATMAELETYIRRGLATFGEIDEEDWRHLRAHAFRQPAEGGYALHYDPAIGDSLKGDLADVDLWAFYDLIACPILIIHGELSDFLLAPTIERMMQRSAETRVFHVPNTGHAPMLLHADQIDVIDDFFGAILPRDAGEDGIVSRSTNLT